MTREIETALDGREWLISGVEFTPDGVSITYGSPSRDLKANGVMHSHTLHVPHGDEYDDEVDAVLDAATALLADVLEDLDQMPGYEALPRDDDDDGDGD